MMNVRIKAIASLPLLMSSIVIGATDEKQFLTPIDPKTLAIEKEKGVRVRPEHTHTALREIAAVEYHAFSKRFPWGSCPTKSLKDYGARKIL